METLTAADGQTLELRRWPLPGQHIGTVYLVHGLGEHIGRYEAVVAALNAAGWRVVGHTLRGHGRSGGARGDIPSPEAHLQDLATVLDHTRALGPRVLLGHSMGGLIAARFVAEGLSDAPAAWYQPVDGLVLSSPALDPGMNAFQKALLALLSSLAPGLRVGNGLKPAWISRDPAVVSAYKADPEVHNRITPRMVRFILDAAALVFERAPRWVTPTLLMWAGADRCVAPRGSAAFAAAALRAPKALLTAREFPEMFHEIFNEPERQQVLDELTRWLAQRFVSRAG